MILGDALDGEGRGNTMMTIPDYRLEPPPAPKYPSCPFCGTDMYDFVFVDVSGDVVGCSECVHTKDPWEYAEMMANED